MEDIPFCPSEKSKSKGDTEHKNSCIYLGDKTQHLKKNIANRELEM